MSDPDETLRNSILKRCSQLECLFATMPKARSLAYTVPLGSIDVKVRTLSGDKLVKLNDTLRLLTQELWNVDDGEGGTVLNTQRHLRFFSEPSCREHYTLMKWATVEKLKIKTNRSLIGLFYCTNQNCRIVCLCGKLHVRDENGELKPLPD